MVIMKPLTFILAAGIFASVKCRVTNQDLEIGKTSTISIGKGSTTLATKLLRYNDLQRRSDISELIKMRDSNIYIDKGGKSITKNIVTHPLSWKVEFKINDFIWMTQIDSIHCMKVLMKYFLYIFQTSIILIYFKK